METVSEEPARKIADGSSAIKVLDSSPLKKDFKSKAELEVKDKVRLADYNMYWHLKEFDPIDIVEHMDLDEKFKRKQQVEAMLKKFRDMPESEHIRNFMKYERVNYKTQLYNKSRKIDSIMKQLNSNNALIEKDQDGVEMMGFSENGKKRLLYGPKI